MNSFNGMFSIAHRSHLGTKLFFEPQISIFPPMMIGLIRHGWDILESICVDLNQPLIEANDYADNLLRQLWIKQDKKTPKNPKHEWLHKLSHQSGPGIQQIYRPWLLIVIIINRTVLWNGLFSWLKEIYESLPMVCFKTHAGCPTMSTICHCLI